jgi:NADP-dependent 3-hydroxy acid dehydrogenase YdfG
MASTKRPEVVVVTGASAGVGRATAQAFARQGAHIGLLARGRAGLESRPCKSTQAGTINALRRWPLAYRRSCGAWRTSL